MAVGVGAAEAQTTCKIGSSRLPSDPPTTPRVPSFGHLMHPVGPLSSASLRAVRDVSRSGREEHPIASRVVNVARRRSSNG